WIFFGVWDVNFLKYSDDGVIMMAPYLVLIIGMFFSVFCLAEQNTIYASPTGGIVEFEGKKVEATELHKALEAARPGTLIQLTPGVYTGKHNIRLTANEASPIVIRGLNEATLFDGKLEPGDDTYCLGFIGATWIKVENIHFKDCWAAP